MHCPSRASGRQAEFTAETNIHFRGLQNLDEPGVLVFAKVIVCLDCGFSRFTTPETELARLAPTSETSIRKGGRARSQSVG
jgi:hypothetical protein